jgi:hypothetical protein
VCRGRPRRTANSACKPPNDDTTSRLLAFLPMLSFNQQNQPRRRGFGPNRHTHWLIGRMGLPLIQHRRAMAWVLAGLAMLVSGCSKSATARLPVHGTVSFANGAKLSGSITFVPAAGHAGPAATTTLADGDYQFDRDTGPTAGPHQVIVRRILSKSAALSARGKKPTEPLPPAESAQKLEWALAVDLSESDAQPCNLTLDREPAAKSK